MKLPSKKSIKSAITIYSIGAGLINYIRQKDSGEQEKGYILQPGDGNEVSFRNIMVTTW
jgi:hypothetical protein